MEDKDGSRRFIAAHNVILCAHSRFLAKERDAFADMAFGVINVDAPVKTGTIHEAVDSAWCAANTL